MRKVIALSMVAALLLVAFVLLAQTTAPTSTYFFSLIFRPPSDARPVKVVPGYFRWQNARGRNETVNLDMLGEVSLDSSDIASRGRPVTFARADSSTLAARYGSVMRNFVLTVTDTTRIDADKGIVSLTVVDMQNGSHVDTTFLISQSGRECLGLITADIDIGLAPFDSISVGDRTIFAWITQDWQ